MRSRNRTRTYNLPVNSRLLCQLSYAGLSCHHYTEPAGVLLPVGLAETNTSASGGVLGHSVSGVRLRPSDDRATPGGRAADWIAAGRGSAMELSPYGRSGREPTAGAERSHAMRMKIAFVTGLGLGFVAGSRAGRGAYDRMVELGRSFAEKPAVRRGAASVQEHASTSAKAAAHSVAGSTREAGAAASQKAHSAWSMAQERLGHGDSGNGSTNKASFNGSSTHGRRGYSSGGR